MGWLVFGIIYTGLYFVAGRWLVDHGPLFSAFRLGALLVPPLLGMAVIVHRRGRWTGCQWLFWAVIALGLLTAAVGHIGWMLDELLMDRRTSWLGWHAVFVMFGTAAPLLALLAQPHRGTREGAAATTAVDIAGIAVVTGFLYSYLTTAGESVAGSAPGLGSTLLLLAELQPLLVFIGMTTAAVLARRGPWGPTYRRLALGLGLSFVTLSLTNLAIARGYYEPGFVYDFMWIMPFMFYPWAAANAPASENAWAEDDERPTQASRPWIIVTVLVLIPAADYLLRLAVPDALPDSSRGLASAVMVVSVLPLLLARLAVERAELRRADDQAQLLAAAIQHANEFVVIRTIDRRFVYANHAFCQALGYTPVDLLTAEARDLFDEESADLIERVVADCRMGRSWRGTLTRRRRDGTALPVAAAVVPFGGAPSRITHLLSVEHDVTEETRMREQLIHSERLSAVGQLVSGVAHELNNPLQSVIGFTELLLDGEKRERARNDLEQVKHEALRAARIVRNLLSFVRRTPSSRAPEDVNDVARSAVALRIYELKTANIEVEERYADGLPPVRVNREEIQQVLLNLLLNAEQAMLKHRGAGRLGVRTGMTGGRAWIEVQDDGPGIPAAAAGKIFEPFFSTKDVGEGTGLGLSIGLGIASAHGGALTLLPSEAGACFRLSLPVPGVSAGALTPAETAVVAAG
jgi:PAS domain S-box-containing protein